MLPHSKRLVTAAVAPSVLLVIALSAGGVIPTATGVFISLFILAGCVWLAHRMERQAEATLRTDTATNAGVEQRVLDTLAEPVMIIDGSRKVLLANAAADNILGPTHIGRDLSVSLRHPTILDSVDTALSGRAVDPSEISLRGNVPLTFIAHVSAVPPSEDSDGRRAVLFLQDVTALKRADAVRVDFVANVSHELRSPLAALVGFIETLQGPALDDPEAHERFLKIMQTEAQRMTRLIEDLLSLSTVESNEHVRPANEVDVKSVVCGVLDTLSARLDERGNSVELDLSETSPTVTGDRDELTQVFHNLLDNAMNYGGPGKPIHVCVRKIERIPETGEAGVSVTVTDQGDGIDPEHLPRLTERFYRVDKGRSRSLGGTGLGLAIVKHIVSRHRGHVAIESTVGEGSAFTVMLPVFAMPQDETPES